MIIIKSIEEIPVNMSEDEAAEFWSTHTMSIELLEASIIEDRLNDVLINVVELHPILKDINIKIIIDQYPIEKPYNPNSKSTPPYAITSVKNPDRKNNKKPYTYEITVFSNMSEYFKEHLYTGSNTDTVKFFNSINVEFNDSSSIVFNLIHELGHVLIYENFKHDSGSYDNLIRLDNINNDIFEFIFKDKDETNFSRMMNNYSFNELYAEKFAYSHFPVVWKKIQ